MRSAWRCTPTVVGAKAGYNRRSLAETAMYRYKAVISRRRHARFCPINGLKRRSDANVLNRMRLGMPVSVQIALYANPEGRRAVIDHQRLRVTARCDPLA